MGEESMEKETIPDQAVEGTGKSGDELHSDVKEIKVITQAERGSENDIVSQAMFSEKPKPEESGARINSTGNHEGSRYFVVSLMAEESMEKETIPDQAEEGTGKSGDELHPVDVMEIEVITQAERGSENDIVSQAMFSEKPKPGGSGARRNSTGNREGRPVPIYLRASTSSCHDFCKYGREQSFPNREKRLPIRALVLGNKESKVELSGVDVQTELKKPSISEQKKKQATKAEATSSPELIAQSSGSTKVIKQKAITPAKKIEITVKPTISSKTKLKPPVSKTSPSPSSPSVGLAKRSNQSSISMNRLKRLSSLQKNRINPVNPSHLLGGLSSEKSERDASNRLENSNGRRRSNAMLTKHTGLSTPVERKTLRSSITTLTPKSSSNGTAQLNALTYQKMKRPSTESIQTRVRTSKAKEDKVSEKTLYMSESKPKRKSSTSSRQSQSSLTLSTSLHDKEDILGSECLTSEAEGSVSEQEDTETCKSNEVPKNGAKRRQSRSKVTHPEDKDEVAQKLSFRRGRVVSLPSENNVARKMRFTRGRVTGENQNGKSVLGRRSFRKKKELGSLELEKPKAGTESVVLRHQDAQGKKEELGLLNEMIEETASKLVEMRKSKVKALVGAFETVISLQESKPATGA
ncbi:uncharacterized protein [Aristolochia californica]|uniref:uncharacterized protein n=1 Tax=Aristolochia californica TaxID=171875 RepID=UPI0035D5F88A